MLNILFRFSFADEDSHSNSRACSFTHCCLVLHRLLSLLHIGFAAPKKCLVTSTHIRVIFFHRMFSLVSLVKSLGACDVFAHMGL